MIEEVVIIYSTLKLLITKSQNIDNYRRIYLQRSQAELGNAKYLLL